MLQMPFPKEAAGQVKQIAVIGIFEGVRPQDAGDEADNPVLGLRGTQSDKQGRGNASAKCRRNCVQGFNPVSAGN